MGGLSAADADRNYSLLRSSLMLMASVHENAAVRIRHTARVAVCPRTIFLMKFKVSTSGKLSTLTANVIA